MGGIPLNVSMHYVSQEVKLTEETMQMSPLEAVLAADIERLFSLIYFYPTAIAFRRHFNIFATIIFSP